MKFSEFCKKNKRKLLLILACGIGCVLCAIGIKRNIAEINELRQMQAKMQTPMVQTVVIEKPVVIEPETAYFAVSLSHEVQDVIFAECEKHGISPALVVAIIERESRYNTEAVGDKGKSFGLMQIKKICHEQRIEKLDCNNLFDPVQNVKVGIDYLAELKQKNGNIFWQLMAYNGGASYADGKAAEGVITEYATEIIARAYELGGVL